MEKSKKKLIRRASIGLWLLVFMSITLVLLFYQNLNYPSNRQWRDFTFAEWLFPLVFTVLFAPIVSFYVPFVYMRILSKYVEKSVNIIVLFICSYLLHAALIFLNPLMLFGFMGSLEMGVNIVLVPSVVFVIGWLYLKRRVDLLRIDC